MGFIRNHLNISVIGLNYHGNADNDFLRNVNKEDEETELIIAMRSQLDYYIYSVFCE